MAHENLIIYGICCCLHLLGDLVSVARLDDLLAEYYVNDVYVNKIMTFDCFWLKLSDKTLLNDEFVQEYQPYGTTAITSRGGNFD